MGTVVPVVFSAPQAICLTTWQLKKSPKALPHPLAKVKRSRLRTTSLICVHLLHRELFPTPVEAILFREDDAPWSMVSDKGQSQEETAHFWCLSVSFFL